MVFCSAHAFVTHIRDSRRAAIAFRNLQRNGIIADRRSQDRESPVEEEEVDWHEEDDPHAVQSVKKGETPQPPTRVLELKLPVPTRWSSVWYMIERWAAVTVVWHPFHRECSCLFAIASVCEWSYFIFQIAGISAIHWWVFTAARSRATGPWVIRLGCIEGYIWGVGPRTRCDGVDGGWADSNRVACPEVSMAVCLHHGPAVPCRPNRSVELLPEHRCPFGTGDEG